MTIDILMSTYNGAAFLGQQIDSIGAQDYRDIRLLIRDDGSTDSTPEILREYEAIDPRISVIRDDLGNLGAFASFMKLVDYSRSPLFMFADQDDVWLPGKVSTTASKMASLTAQYGPDEPIAVFTDMAVVDQKLETIHPSLWKYQGYDPAICKDWKKLLSQNKVLGCTLMANAKVRELCLPFALPDMPHDHWVAVHAAKYGRVEFIPEQTMLYRQHVRNYSGAHRFGIRYSAERLPGLISRIGEFRRAASFFGEVSTARLLFYKVWLNLRRFQTGSNNPT